jgi:hypothetical protein
MVAAYEEFEASGSNDWGSCLNLQAELGLIQTDGKKYWQADVKIPTDEQWARLVELYLAGELTSEKRARILCH